MKIRTRLLLFLLPILIGSIALISSLFAYNWYGEIREGFQTRLKAAVISAALAQKADTIREDLQISNLRTLPVDHPEIDAMPKVVHTTPIYQSDSRKIMTGYAPIYNETGDLSGMIAADISVELIDQKFQECLLLILLCAGFISLIVFVSLYIIANKISRPVQKLNNSALAIAAGEYGQSIQVQGPREIAELANTLNTMSECLHENINRLKENSRLREKMYGEYECSMLLQHLMLQKNIDACQSDAVAVKSITFFSENPKGFLLDFPKTTAFLDFRIHLAEAAEEGLEGMYQLLTDYKHAKISQTHTSLILDPKIVDSQSTHSVLHWEGAHTPFVWSLENGRFIQENSSVKVEAGDFFFLCNHGLLSFYREKEKLLGLLSKVLNIFANDGLDTIVAMLQKELSFAMKRRDLSEDIHLLCFQILKGN